MKRRTLSTERLEGGLALRRRVRLDDTVAQGDDPIGERRRLRVVRHHHERLVPLLDEAPQEIEHRPSGLRVEVAGGLVGEDEERIGHERARDRDALHLPAGELIRPVSATLLEPHEGEELPRLGRHPGRRDAVEEEREHHVLLRRERGEEVEELEDEPQPPPAKRREAIVRVGLDRLAGEAHAPGRGAIEATEEVQERALPRAAGADDGDQLAAGDVEGDAAQRVDLPGAARVGLSNAENIITII